MRRDMLSRLPLRLEPFAGATWPHGASPPVIVERDRASGGVNLALGAQRNHVSGLLAVDLGPARLLDALNDWAWEANLADLDDEIDRAFKRVGAP